MRFIKEFKIFEGVETMPELGTKWINDKGEKIFILKSDQYNEFIGYYNLADPGSKKYIKPETFYAEYKPLDKHIYRDDIEFDFDKATYLSDERAIIAAYFITKQNEKSIEILNIKEFAADTATFGDNARPYSVTFHKGTLPTSQIAILGEVPEKEGFFYVKVPYWLYKETPELNIKRIVGDFHHMKRLDLRDHSLRNKELMSNFKDPNVIKYFASYNKDERTQQQVVNYGRQS
jgi:hypothetical protein